MFQERFNQAKTWGKKRKERKRKRDKGRKKEKGKEKERKVNVSTDVVNYPIKQFSSRSKNRNGNVLSQILIAFDGTKNKKSH